MGTTNDSGLEGVSDLDRVAIEAIRGCAQHMTQTEMRRRTKLSQTTVNRFANLDNASPGGLSGKAIDGFCRLPEVRLAIAAHLLNRPVSKRDAWTSIAGDISKILDLSAGQELVAKLREAARRGPIDSFFAMLDGYNASRESPKPRSKSRNKPAKTSKKERSA